MCTAQQLERKVEAMSPYTCSKLNYQHNEHRTHVLCMYLLVLLGERGAVSWTGPSRPVQERGSSTARGSGMPTGALMMHMYM